MKLKCQKIILLDLVITKLFKYDANCVILIVGQQVDPQPPKVSQPTAAAAAAAATATTISKKPLATPAVRRIASEHNVRNSVVWKSSLLPTVIHFLFTLCKAYNINHEFLHGDFYS